MMIMTEIMTSGLPPKGLNAYEIKEGKKTQFILIETGDILVDQKDLATITRALLFPTGETGHYMFDELLFDIKDEIEASAGYAKLANDLQKKIDEIVLKRPNMKVSPLYEELSKFVKVLGLMGEEEGRHSRNLHKGILDLVGFYREAKWEGEELMSRVLSNLPEPVPIKESLPRRKIP
jgi:phosphomannomutase